MTTPIVYAGGKTKLSRKIIPYIPPHKNYLELFFGGGSIFFEKKPSELETINDINSNVTTFFKVLQDKNKFEEFYRLANLTPYSREFFYELRDGHPENDIEKAYRFFVLSRQSFSGNLKDWSFNVNCHYSVPGVFQNTIKRLPQIVDRLKNVQIENLDFKRCLKLYDNEDCFIYADPPYIPESRRENSDLYEYEMTYEDHERLLSCCLKAKGKIMISGYNSDLYNAELKDWRKKEFKARCTIAVKSKDQERTEVIWMNYEYNPQPELF